MKRLLMKALKNCFKMEKHDAIALTKTVEEIFNGQEEVEDMSIDKYSRALFYELQRKKLIKIRREEFKEQGRIIRRYYWSFDAKLIKKAANIQTCEDPYNIYKKIPRSAWLRNA